MLLSSVVYCAVLCCVVVAQHYAAMTFPCDMLVCFDGMCCSGCCGVVSGMFCCASLCVVLY